MMQGAYQKLREHFREIGLWTSIDAVLDWDASTYLPDDGSSLRGEQRASLVTLVHQKLADPKVAEWIAEIESSKEANEPRVKGTLRECKRQHRMATLVPARLLQELAMASTEGKKRWEEGRAKNDFSIFLPSLETLLRLKREEAKCIAGSLLPYDGLIDQNEPGMTSAQLIPLFEELKVGLMTLLQRIESSKIKVRSELFQRHYPIDLQQKLGEQALRWIGFDLKRGRLDSTVHPFCCGVSPKDVRLTTRYNERDFGDSFFSVLHEGGHGLYEQGLPTDEFGLPGGRACSFGVHESQSRLWENIVGRSEAFWEFAFPKLKLMFPAALNDFSLREFVIAVNQVTRSFIRVDADEVTYNLHVILRFEIERALVSGEAEAKEVPHLWDEKFMAMMGLKPPTNRQGCLQDVHWSMGGFGYFPAYTIGNLLSVQWTEAAERALGSQEENFRRGEFEPLKQWLVKNVHEQGSLLLPDDLCRTVTGAPLSVKPFLNYLESKFQGLYAI